MSGNILMFIVIICYVVGGLLYSFKDQEYGKAALSFTYGVANIIAFYFID